MPTISVIIPVYNSAKTIQSTIESVLNQTFTDFELILINDGSTDNSLAIISQIQDPRIQVFSFPNRGVSASRNEGISRANSDYISFLDADDLWTADKLAAQFQALQTHPEAAVAYSWTDYIDECDQFLHPGNHPTATGNVYSQMLLSNFLENGSNALIRRTALDSIGGFNETLFGPEDWDLLIRLAARYPFVVVMRSQILYRMSTQSVSLNLSRQESHSLRVINSAFAQAPAELQSLKKQSLANLYQYLAFRTLAQPLTRKTALTAAKFLTKSLRYHPGLLQRKKLLLITVAKIILATILPATKVEKILKKLKERFQK